MKKIFLTLFLVLGSLTINAQELTWQTDINKAMEISKKTKKPLLLFLPGVTGAVGVSVCKKKF